jgi:hypothetical protein
MASQQMERAAELQNPEVRAELNRCVRKCERKCFASGRLGSIPQACARARQQATREQVKGQWCESSTGIVCKRCDRARRSCKRLRGCAGPASAAHVREQRRLSREPENPEVRKGVGIANQSSSFVSSQGSTTSSSSYSSSIAEQDPKSPWGLSLRPFSTHYNSRQTSSSPTESRHRQVLLIADSVHRGNSLSVCSSP